MYKDKHFQLIANTNTTEIQRNKYTNIRFKENIETGDDMDCYIKR